MVCQKIKFIIMKKNNLYCMLFVLLIMSLMSCRKEREDRNKTWDNKMTVDNGTSENLFNDLFKVVDDVSDNTAGIKDLEITCIDTIIVDTSASPRTVLIDFGQDDCAGADGKIRKGQIQVTYTGRYREQGTIITITPISYTINGYSINGTKTITNLGANSSGQTHFSISVNGTVTAPGNAWSATWYATRTRTWIEGEGTMQRTDDVYQISGGGGGVNRNGVSYTVSITTPLRIELDCPYIVSGVVAIQPAENDLRIVNFGSGTCDNAFSVTVNGETFELGTEG